MKELTSLRLASKTLVFLSAILLCRNTTDLINKNYFIVWNVGQGQWNTALTSESCHHFDWGGEKFPLQKMNRICSHKLNEFYFSHWDWDHIGGLRFLRKLRINSCLRVKPSGISPSKHKSKLFSGLLPCYSRPNLNIEEVPLKQPIHRALTSNEMSHVFIYHHHILIPGDSTQWMEKQWGISPLLEQVTILQLGHHGSKTSTSDDLLDHLPHLKMAIASARLQKYGHPHVEVLQKLKRRKIPVLSTEIWGSIWIELP